jgi:hypothetical protein
MGKKKSLTVKDVLKGKPLVEIVIGGRCEHECFTITAGSSAVYRFVGLQNGIKVQRGGVMVIHEEECDDEACMVGCWGND